MHLLLIKN
ncbi:hypothetical protein YPPY03_3498, partial [Yersinia pestis PY-03]